MGGVELAATFRWYCAVMGAAGTLFVGEGLHGATTMASCITSAWERWGRLGWWPSIDQS